MVNLKTEFEKHFGEVHFTNCTNQIYNFEEIMLFLKQRNKILTDTENIEVIWSPSTEKFKNLK